ncbi:hypothetical protein V495_02379 [Pseudogymnoascus sp. VKM F-4514 (FW-929)]|nr:hypothetical protein V490_09431 [Pseudogymnoascus sp. VKM F-3557]KFY46587.1 hypothetical protein V495_02379 [Pseudogymnoascus sp. VKM F-4514 (FW-929)]KFY61695.1 hypothetical protein V497_02799 [Pseudogymnoascus sp. VKM F-4516 (FW-969)]
MGPKKKSPVTGPKSNEFCGLLPKDSVAATEVSERRARNTRLWLEDAALAVVEDDEDDGNGDDDDKNLIEV